MIRPFLLGLCLALAGGVRAAQVRCFSTNCQFCHYSVIFV